MAHQDRNPPSARSAVLNVAAGRRSHGTARGAHSVRGGLVLQAALLTLLAFGLGQVLRSAVSRASECLAGEDWGLAAPTLSTDDPQGDSAVEEQLWQIQGAGLFVEDELLLEIPDSTPATDNGMDVLVLEPVP